MTIACIEDGREDKRGKGTVLNNKKVDEHKLSGNEGYSPLLTRIGDGCGKS